MRLSRYAILSEKNDDGTWVVMHGITGALDIVSSGVVAGLRRFGEFRMAQGRFLSDIDVPDPADHRPLTDSERATLADRGYLTDVADEVEQDAVRTIAAVLHDEAARTPSFLVLPSLDCNYRCTYCFERPVQLELTRTDRTRHPELNLLDIRASHANANVVMTPEMVDALYEAIRAAQAKHEDVRQTGQIVLYGGEPLDAANESIVRYIVTEGTRRGFRFAAITNGHDLDTFVDLCGPGRIEQVQISIDGPRDIHDRRRITLDRTSSYDRIVRNVASLLQAGGTLLQIRVHLDYQNVEHFEELLQEFAGFGWLGHPDILIYANTVYRMTPGSPVETDLSLDEVDARLRVVVSRHKNLFLNAPNINIRAKWLPALARGEQIPVQGNYCTANTGQYVFAPDGYIYSCWESVGKSDSRIGSFYAGGRADMQMDLAKTRSWFSRHTGLIPECTACPMALICGGGCAQFALYGSGTQLAPYCDNFDALLRSGLRDTAATLVAKMADEVNGVEPTGGLVVDNYG